MPSRSRPSALVAQGRKQVIAGTSVYLYDRAKYLIASVNTPTSARSWKPVRGSFCLRLDLDPAVIGALMLEPKSETTPGRSPSRHCRSAQRHAELLDAAVRLVRLAVPRDISILAPLAEREILYRFCSGDQSSKYGGYAVAESKLQQINRAIG